MFGSERGWVKMSSAPSGGCAGRVVASEILLQLLRRVQFGQFDYRRGANEEFSGKRKKMIFVSLCKFRLEYVLLRMDMLSRFIGKLVSFHGDY